MTKKHGIGQWAQIAAITAVSFVMAFTIFRQDLTAKWGPADDHEILKTIGHHQRLPVREILGALKTTEVWPPRKFFRYRPTYYVLRVLECAAWGANPTAWYAARILMFGSVLALAMWLLSQLFGPPAGMMTVVWLATWPFWGDLFTRLGPAETYASVGVALFAVACYKCFLRLQMSKPVPAGLVAVLVLAACLAIGSKENFTIAVLPVLLLTAMAWKKRCLNRALWSGVAVCVAYTALIVYAVTPSALGANPGAHNVSFRVTPVTPLHIAFAAAVGFALLVVIRFAGREDVWRAPFSRFARRLLVLEAVLLALFLSQHVFYGEIGFGVAGMNFPEPCASRWEKPRQRCC